MDVNIVAQSELNANDYAALNSDGDDSVGDSSEDSFYEWSEDEVAELDEESDDDAESESGGGSDELLTPGHLTRAEMDKFARNKWLVRKMREEGWHYGTQDA